MHWKVYNMRYWFMLSVEQINMDGQLIFTASHTSLWHLLDIWNGHHGQLLLPLFQWELRAQYDQLIQRLLNYLSYLQFFMNHMEFYLSGPGIMPFFPNIIRQCTMPNMYSYISLTGQFNMVFNVFRSTQRVCTTR